MDFGRYCNLKFASFATLALAAQSQADTACTMATGVFGVLKEAEKVTTKTVLPEKRVSERGSGGPAKKVLKAEQGNVAAGREEKQYHTDKRGATVVGGCQSIP